MTTEELSIEQEIVEKTQCSKQFKKEERNDYLARLAKSALSVSNEEWGGFSRGTQLWVDEAIKSLKKKVKIPELPNGEDLIDPTENDTEAEEIEMSAIEPIVEAEPPDPDPGEPTKRRGLPHHPSTKVTEAESHKEENQKKREEREKERAEEREKKRALGRKPRISTAGAIDFFREQAILNPDMDRVELMDLCQKQGHIVALNSITLTYYEVRKTMALLKARGMLKK